MRTRERAAVLLFQTLVGSSVSSDACAWIERGEKLKE